MQALDGKLVRKYYDDVYTHCMVQDYIIDVNQAIDTYAPVYEKYIFIDSEGEKYASKK